MKRILLFLPLVMLLSCCGESITWKRVAMDSSRTGVIACNADNVAQALGTISDSVYTAPNGRTFTKESATYKVAQSLVNAQPKMADLKTVIGYSPREMKKEKPESALSDWFIDELMRYTEQKSGKKVDIGITNFGGIRVDMPVGDVLKDDIVSMFPFKNNLCYLELAGTEVRALLEQFAATGWQVVGGARCVVKDGKLVSAEIDGKPLDDKRIYGVCTISFLLNGGDDIFVARNAKRLDIYPEYIIDVMLPYVLRTTAEGKNVEYETDGRIQIIKEN
ncbi:MAG: 5'-nucleotidase C-terminal domain-containing protein [Bacteroidales bacterium]|nr:5'-nucleotidase C-terminal domain-containing protein [Bacteroidales bacterium]